MTLSEKIVIWGASGHAKVVAEIIRLKAKYEIVGFLDSINQGRWGQEFCGAKILGGEEQLDHLIANGVRHLIFGFGDCSERMRLAQLVKAKGYQLAFAIHPHSSIALDVSIQPGDVVVAGAIINPGCQIGENVIINTAATVGHDSIIGDGVHVSPGVNLGGNIKVGTGTWIGIGACVRDHVTIGGDVIIGAGSVVVKDIPDHVVAYGNPARVKRLKS